MANHVSSLKRSRVKRSPRPPSTAPTSPSSVVRSALMREALTRRQQAQASDYRQYRATVSAARPQSVQKGMCCTRTPPAATRAASTPASRPSFSPPPQHRSSRPRRPSRRKDRPSVPSCTAVTPPSIAPPEVQGRGFSAIDTGCNIESGKYCAATAGLF